MFVYSKTSTSKTVHLESCSYALGMVKENTGYFYSLKEAFDAGYHLCKACSPLGKCYRKEQKAINDFCKKAKFICRWENGHIYIETSIESWLIVYSPRMKGNAIYHKNVAGVNTQPPSTYESIPGYHRQKWNFRSILDTLESIYDHQWIYLEKSNLPKNVKYHINLALRKKPPTSKKTKAKANHKTKNFEKHQQANNVLDLLKHL